STTATSTISGTSMASPHVAGAAALYLASNASATPAQVTSAITGNATSGKVTSAGSGSVNRLLYTLGLGTGGGGGGEEPPPPPPPPTITAHVEALTATTQRKGQNWSATVTIRVHSSGNANVSG